MTNVILSIVIANYNYGRFLEAAIKSVVEQEGFSQCELIVVDGGSVDNSVEIIKRYANKISWWVSERDKGQSDAFNKGFAHARGKYLTWVNADDVMPRGCLGVVIRELERHPYCEWFTGNFYRFTEGGKVIEIGWGPHWLPSCLQTAGQPLAIYGPSTFFAKKLFDRVGGMKIYQNFMMDTDLWMRFIVSGVKQRRINCFCWAFRMHMKSKTAEFGGHKLPAEQQLRFAEERTRSYRETGYHESFINKWLIRFWRVVDLSFLRRLYLMCIFRTVDREGI